MSARTCVLPGPQTGIKGNDQGVHFKMFRGVVAIISSVLNYRIFPVVGCEFAGPLRATARSAKRVLAIVILSVRLHVCLSRPDTKPSPGEIETSGFSPCDCVESLVFL